MLLVKSSSLEKAEDFLRQKEVFYRFGTTLYPGIGISGDRGIVEVARLIYWQRIHVPVVPFFERIINGTNGSSGYQNNVFQV